MTTDVKPEDLNYDDYPNDKYDRDIAAVIPGHAKMHERISDIVLDLSTSTSIKRILELGPGTGLTSEVILRLVPDAHLKVIEFSDRMLQGARERLSEYDVSFVPGDYSEIDLGSGYDLVVSVIGIHHQEDPEVLFGRVYDSLNTDGMFLFGDLVTYSDDRKAAEMDARHFAHLVENVPDAQSLREWAYHHKFKNNLTALEAQVDMLDATGFEVTVEFEYLNTALITAKKL